MSFPQYPTYKNSGEEWLGEIPEHWNILQLKRRLRFDVGWTPPTGQDEFFDGDLPWANISDLGPRTIFQTAKMISPLAVEAAKLSLIPKGSLLFSFKLSIGQVSFAGIDMYSNEAIASFSPQDDVDLRFMYYVLPLFVTKNANENIYGAKLLNQDLIKNAYIIDVPLSEQCAIANFLDAETARIDALVAKQEELIATLQEKRRALISHGVTKGLDPSTPMKDSRVPWLGEVPAHWEVKRLKHCLLSIEQGWSPQCENRPAEDNEWGVLKVGCVNGNTFNPNENKALPIDLEPVMEYTIRKGDILVSRANTRELVGSAAIAVHDYPKLLLCDKLYRLRLNTSVFSPDFVVLLLRAPLTRNQIEIEATGASQSMQNIAQDTIRNLVFAFPSLSEQHLILAEIAQQTYHIDTLITKAERLIALLREHRLALITAAVTGQIDVRGYAAGNGAVRI